MAALQNELLDGKLNETIPQAEHRRFFKTIATGQTNSNQDANKKYAMDTRLAGQHGEDVAQQKELRRSYLLEKFREKARLDREKGRGELDR